MGGRKTGHGKEGKKWEKEGVVARVTRGGATVYFTSSTALCGVHRPSERKCLPEKRGGKKASRSKAKRES